MGIRIGKLKKAEPGSARDKSSKRMKEKWKDPAYREEVSNRQKAKWKDPAYRAKIMASKGNPVPTHLLPALAEHYDAEIARIKAKIKTLSQLVAELGYVSSMVREGHQPRLLDRVLRRGTNIAYRYSGQAVKDKVIPAKGVKKGLRIVTDGVVGGA